jgi:hypothetical protein
MLAGVADPRTDVLTPGSLTVIALTFAASVAATVLQVRYADNTQ